MVLLGFEYFLMHPFALSVSPFANIVQIDTGEGRRVAKASQGGPPTLEAERKVRSKAEACSEAKAGG